MYMYLYLIYNCICIRRPHCCAALQRNPSLCVAACASSFCAAFGFLWQLILHKSEEQMRQDFRIEKRIKLDGAMVR